LKTSDLEKRVLKIVNGEEPRTKLRYLILKIREYEPRERREGGAKIPKQGGGRDTVKQGITGEAEAEAGGKKTRDSGARDLHTGA